MLCTLGHHHITMTVTMAPTSMGLAALGQHDVVLLPQMVLKNTSRDSVGHITVPQQQQLQSQMPSQAYVNYVMDLPQLSFLFQS